MRDGLKRIGDAVIAACKAHVAGAVGALARRLDDFDARLNALPAGPRGERGTDGLAGKDGRDGKDGEAGLPGAHGAAGERGADGLAGKDGRDGKDGESGLPGPHGAVGERGADGREGKDGRDGREGKNGESGRDALALDILPGIEESKSYPRGTFAEYRGGTIRAIRNTDPITDGLEKAGWVVSMNGIAEEAEETLDEGRTIRRMTVYTNGRAMVREIKTSVILYRGIWREGTFERGDVVTWSGSSWHCQETTVDKPGTSAAWKLMVKRGGDGKDGGGGGSAPAAREPVRLK